MITAEDLLELLRPLGPFAEPVRDLAVIQLTDSMEASLEVRLGRWQWNAAPAAVQSAIATAVLLPVCYATGANEVPIVVLSVVLPFLVNAEQVEVRDSDLHVLARIKDDLLLPNDVERVYQELPGDLQHEISLLEFRDLVQRLTGSGHLSKNDLGRYRLTRQAYRDLRSILS
ncbi:VQ motif-containing protein [Humibacillus xanthopallidus]|uniref:VQ motif-containing protein n=1 Tax=Humibacillus xanthopallidus TaxID=412689 RepID=A0A543PKQ8_9MICO|nr:hypothetical protein [Humibacillus xanthopallidus]TQN44660.1 VQ motif-containing protein [Humibacillus xanthopallidus]